MHVSHHQPLPSYLMQPLPEPKTPPKPPDTKSAETASIAEDLKQDGKRGSPMRRKPQKPSLRKTRGEVAPDGAADDCPAGYPFFL